MAFVGQLFRVHFGRRRYPQAYGNIALAFQEFRSGTEVTDVGHARTDEYFVDFGAGTFGHETYVVRVVRTGDNRLFDVVHIDFNHGGVFGIFIRFKQLRVRQPFFHGFDAAFQSTRVLIAVGNHVFHQHDVGFHVLDNHQIAQGYARLQLAAEAYQYGLRHIERHYAGSCCESNQAGACWEGNADRETGVAVATGTDCIRQQQAVKP